VGVIAALYVARGGPYYGLADVDPWDVERDARGYAGPHRVIAHPPCERWGRYWSGGPNPQAARRELGDDGGCFALALSAVRTWGGVLEHPEASRAWAFHNLRRPPRAGGWVEADSLGGFTCCVEQGHYGHHARKATWLYAYGTALPELVWGPSDKGVRIEEGFHSKEEAMQARTSPGYQPVPRVSVRARVHTPVAFRDALLALVRATPAQARRAS
jgi:hypothetical protein